MALQATLATQRRKPNSPYRLQAWHTALQQAGLLQRYPTLVHSFTHERARLFFPGRHIPDLNQEEFDKDMAFPLQDHSSLGQCKATDQGSPMTRPIPTEELASEKAWIWM